MRMSTIIVTTGLASLLLSSPAISQSRPGRPAPPPSRYTYTLEINNKSLPEGVTVRKVDDGLGARHFIKNSSETPLIINGRFEGERLVAGTKLVGGKVYLYFPNGVPMEGKTHLKGWQAPFGDSETTLLVLDSEPAKIYEGRKPGLGKELPPPEVVTIPANYDGKPYGIIATVHYHLNPAYDAEPPNPAEKIDG